MSYNSGQIAASATQPAKDLMDTLKTHIDAHAAWTFEEEVAGTGTNVAQVFKCLGTSNAWGTDFFISLIRTSLTSRVGVCLFETFDNTAKTAGKPALVVGSNTGFGPQADGSSSVTRHVADQTTMSGYTHGHLLGAGFEGTPGAAGGIGTSTSVATDYWIAVTDDCVILKVCPVGGSHTGAFVGWYESFHASTADPAPLVISVLATTPSFQTLNYGAFTREKGGTAHNYNYAAALDPKPYTPNVASNFTSTVTKETVSQKWWASRVMAVEVGRRNTMRGLLPSEIVMLDMGENTEAIGDEVSIDGVDYTCFQTGTSGLWVSQAA